MAKSTITFEAKPYGFSFQPSKTALLVIDMQRDFLLSNGFGDELGANLSEVQNSIKPTLELLKGCRAAGLHIFHTREGHQADLSDCPTSKLIRQAASPNSPPGMKKIGDDGSMGRILIRGSYGHDLVDELQPRPDEVVIDKPGKGTFWNTSILHKLKARGITHLLVSGVTTECCFAMSIREANDRGFECCGVVEATAGYNPAFKTASLDMIEWSQGLFGFVAHIQPVLDALKSLDLGALQTSVQWDGRLDITSLSAAYRRGLSPVTLVETLYSRIERYQVTDPAVWIRLEPRDRVLAAAAKLAETYPDRSRLPLLFGVPFSVKDSIDVAGVPTTTACPPLAYVPSKSARCFELVSEQGGLYLGKVNLDQLATGLSGCRSPYGVTHSVFSEKHISGGSSSGSCVSVGAQLVSFSLATDTAGSGRVPAGFNGVVGYKPTRGLISFRGVVPACLSLDCIAIIASNVPDVRTVWQVCEGYDEEDPYARDSFPAERHVDSVGNRSRFKFGIPSPTALAVCSAKYQELFDRTIQEIQKIGGQSIPIDYRPFSKAADLLYEGTFVSERLASLPDDFVSSKGEQLHPVIRELFDRVVQRQSTAVQAYRDLQNKVLFTRQACAQFRSADRDGMDVLIVPTAPGQPKIEDMLNDPIALNARLGTFTHFGNVLDLCAAAIPVGKYTEDGVRLPFSITLLGARCTDAEVLQIADMLQKEFAECEMFS